MVRPLLEYCSTVWSPHTKEYIQKIEMVQHRAARYVTNRYHNTSSVTSMLDHLEWETLESRRISWSCSSKLYMALWTYCETSTWHLHLHGLALVTLLNTDKFPLPVTTTNTASSLKQFVSGIPFQPQWLRLPVWYLSNGSSLRYHSKKCRPGQM